MSSEAAVKEQIVKLRREVQLSHDLISLQRTIQETQRCLERIANKPNHTLRVAHVVKELIDWVALKDDRVLESTAGKECVSLYEQLLSVCYDGEKNIRKFLLSRLYSAIVAVCEKDSCSGLKLLIARQMSRFPIEPDVAEMFVRVKVNMIKTLHERKGKTTAELEEYADFVIELHHNLLMYEAGKERSKSESVRKTLLALFGEVFDKKMAILYRLYAFNRAKGQRLYQTVMDTMREFVQLEEQELIALLPDSIAYVERILAYSVEHLQGYGQFAKFLTLFDAIRTEPYTECCKVLRLLVRFVQGDQPSGSLLSEMTTSMRILHESVSSHPLVVSVAIFLTQESSNYLSSLSQRQAMGVSKAAIGLYDALMPFVRHCPSEAVPELCRTCTSPRRHLADKVLSMLMYFNAVQARDAADRKTSAATLSYSINRGCGLIERKLTLLEELTCERKQSLMDKSMRSCISWLKNVITLQHLQYGAGTSGQTVGNGDAEQTIISQTLKLLITVQNRYRFDFLSDLYLVRLLESTYIDSVRSCWLSVSVRLLKLLLTLRDASTGTVQEHATSISSIVRAIMSIQVNVPEDHPIRSLTILQLYGHPSFDRHGFSFDCAPSRAEQFTILAEEMTLAVKYRTSYTRPCWEYMQQLAQLGCVREHCLTFGLALHCFGETDFAKLPKPMMDTLLDALKAHQPASTLERVKRFASLGILSYHSYTAASRAVVNRLRDIPLKVEQLRSGQIDEFLAGNRLDREAELVRWMEAIRTYYAELVAALEEDNFRSIWVLASVTYVSNILDNTACLFHLSYYPHWAVELQLLHYRILQHRSDVRPLDQCAALALLLDQPELTNAQLKGKNAHCDDKKKKDDGTLASLEDVAKRATGLLPSAGTSIDHVPDNRKFQLLNLYLTLAVYHASRREYQTALGLLHRAQGHLEKSTNVNQLAKIVEGRTAQIIFRLVAEYELPWPETVPPFALMKQLLVSFNELQRLCLDHTFSMSLATVEMTTAVLQYLVVRYNAGALIEPHVETVIKFLLRSGAGLRVVQLLLLYGQMCADTQKLDRVEIVLGYLDRLLMLQPILSEEKENGKLVNELALSGRHKMITTLPVASQSIVKELVDVGREAAPKNRIAPPLVAWDETIEHGTVAERYLMFHHARGCDCRYCSLPQYKSMAFQAGALAVRLDFLQGIKLPNQIERSYELLCQHWRTEIFPNLFDSAWAVPTYRTGLIVAMIRMLLNKGHFHVLQGCDGAREAYRWASELSALITEPAIASDVRYNLNALAYLLNRPNTRSRRSPSTLRARHTELLAKLDKTNSGGGDNVSGEGKISPTMDMVTTNLTKITISKTPARAGRTAIPAPPRTVDRVNELIRQAALIRHQLNSPGKDVLLAADGTVPSSTHASARKPKSVNIFVDSPPNRSVKRNDRAPATVGKMVKPSFSSARVKVKGKALEAADVVDLTKHIVDGKDAPVSGGSKRVADSYKDVLLQKDTPTPPGARSTKKKNDQRVRRLIKDDYPCLPSDSSDTEASTKSSRTDSPALNGSFRDVLVLGETGAKKNDTPEVIVLDDTVSDKSHHSLDDAIDSSIIDHSHAVSADKRAGLSHKTYSARKRLLGSGPRSASSSSAVRSKMATERRLPLLAAKTKLKFDDAEQSQPNGKAGVGADVEEGTEKNKKIKIKNSTAASKNVMDPPIAVPPRNEPEAHKVEPRISSIATRTRLRSKRI